MIKWEGASFDWGQRSAIRGTLEDPQISGAIWRVARPLGPTKAVTCEKIMETAKEIEAELWEKCS